MGQRRINNSPDRKALRREEATVRQEERLLRSDEEQLALMASRRGENKRERKALGN